MNFFPVFSRSITPAFQAVLEASWQGLCAILLVVLARRLLGARVPARWRHAFWLLVLVRLLVPAFAFPCSPTSLQNIPALHHPVEQTRRIMSDADPSNEAAVANRAFLAQRSLPVAQAGSGENFRPPTLSNSPRPGAAASNWTLWRVAAWVWLIGMLLCGGWVCAGMLWWQYRLRQSCTPVDTAVEQVWRACSVRLATRRAPRLLATEWVTSPALVGWWRPTLLIPERVLANFTADDWENVFLHEIAHLCRRDHWTQAVQLLALCVHWFNPVVWFGLRALRADRELATDERALGWVRADSSLAYGETLLKMLASGRGGPSLTPALVVGIMEEGTTQLKERLRRIAAFTPHRTWRGGVLGAAVLGALATVVLGQQTQAPAPTAADLALYEGLAPVDQLHSAASNNDLPMLRKLLDEGVDPNVTTQVGWESTVLAIAAFDNRFEAVKLLVEKGARINGAGGDSVALLVALRNGSLECADYLLSQGAKCDPILLAASRGDTAAVDRWLAEENPTFDQIRTAGEDAGITGHTELFARLYDAARAVPGHERYEIDHGGIRRAVAHGQRGMVEEMMRRDEDFGASVLRLATAAACSPGMREWLNGKGHDVPAANDNEWFIDAVDRDDVPEMRRWFAKGTIDINYRGESGWTPLTRAAIIPRFAALKELLAHKADPNLVRFPGSADYTPLCFAATPAIAEALVAAGADLQGKTFNGRGNAMSYAASVGLNDMVKWYLDHGVLPVKRDGSTDDKPSLFAASTADIVEMLLARGADLNAKDERGDSVLMHTVTQHYQPAGTVRALLKHGADPNFYSTYWKCTPLGAASDSDTVDALIEGGADINAKDQYGYSALCAITTSPDDAARCEALMRHGLKLDVEKEGGRLMWLATARDQPKWVKMLLDHGVSAEAVWYSEPGHRDQGTPLGMATSFGRTEMVKLLLDHGAKPDGGEMAFAMSSGYKDTARMMWERGVRTSSELAYAVSQGAPVADLAKIIDSGVPVDPPQDKVFTPLRLAVSLGNLETVKFLADRGASLSGALGEAVQTGHDQIVEYLLNKGEKTSWDLMAVLGSNSHPYEKEQPERCFNHIAEMLIKAGALENLSEANAAHILRATTFTRNPGGNPVILKLLFAQGLRVDSRFNPPPKPGEPAPVAASSDDGATFLEMVEKRAKKGVDGYSPIPPETFKVIEEAKEAQRSAK